MTKTLLPFFLLVLTLSLQTQAAPAATAKDEPVAIIGTKKITVDEFNKKFTDVKNMSVNPPTKQQFLEDLVRYEVGLQEAERRGLEKDPVVQDRMKQELYKALVEKELGEKVNKTSVSEKEMEAYYKNNPEIRTSHILIELKPGASAEQRAEAKKRATEIYEEVKKSKRPFEELVHLYSDDVLTKQAGGDVGFQSRVTLVPSYYEAILAMKIGDVKGLIETPFGYHIVKVTGRRSFENANKRQLRAAVFDEKRKGLFNEYFDTLKKNTKIQTFPKNLE